MSGIYENILGTVGNTPVVRIGKLAPAGINLFVKIEAFNPMGSVKDRLALGVIEDAEKSGALKPGQTVIEATSGNTGIGLAMVCAQKGYPLVVTMAESFSVERRKLMRFLGAKVVLTPAPAKGTGMVAKAQELAKANDWFLTSQFENESNPDMHTRTTAREIINDFELRIASPKGYEPNKNILHWAKKKGGNILLTKNPVKAASSVDCVMTDKWISMGDKINKNKKKRALIPYQVNKKIMKAANKDAIFMHCLPASRGEEVTNEIIDGKKSVVWLEALNRIHAQKSIIEWCLK